MRGGYIAERSKHVPIYTFSLTAFKVLYLVKKNEQPAGDGDQACKFSVEEVIATSTARRWLSLAFCLSTTKVAVY